MLHNLGHQVVAVAEIGDSLIKLCSETKPDVVITGTLTSAKYGSDAAAIVYKNRPLPILLYSEHCEPNLVRNAEHWHVFMCLARPISQQDLQKALEECRKTESNDPSGGDAEVVRA